jgi:hypothetical protein
MQKNTPLLLIKGAQPILFEMLPRMHLWHAERTIQLLGNALQMAFLKLQILLAKLGTSGSSKKRKPKILLHPETLNNSTIKGAISNAKRQRQAKPA